MSNMFRHTVHKIRVERMCTHRKGLARSIATVLNAVALARNAGAAQAGPSARK